MHDVKNNNYLNKYRALRPNTFEPMHNIVTHTRKQVAGALIRSDQT
jgi:hypothetical protein